MPFKAVTRLASNFCISELEAPEEFQKKSIADLNFPESHGVQCIGKRDSEDIEPIGDDYLVTENDVLLFAGTIKNLSRLPKPPKKP